MQTSTSFRIQVVGSSGSGKTTFAKELARQLDLPHLELDSIYHQRDWQPLPTEEFRLRVEAFANNSKWVVDGNYSKVGDLLQSRITHLVWLDYPRWFVMQRLARRSLRRVFTKEELWNGNREELRNLLSGNAERNVMLWSWISHSRNRKRYGSLAAANRPFKLIRLTSPRMARAFLNSLED